MKKISFIISLFFCLNAVAQENLTSDRPGQSNSAFSLGEKEIQLQGGSDYFRSSAKDSLQTKVAAIISNLTVRYGLPGNLEIRSSCNYNWNTIRDLTEKSNSEGPSDWLVGVRKTLWDRGDSSTSMALAADFFIPFKNEVYDRSTLRPQISVLLYQPIGKSLSIASNLAFRFGEGASVPSELFYTLSLGYSISSKLSGFVEAYGTGISGIFNTKIDGGLAYLLRPNLQLDLFGGFFRSPSTTENFISIGFSWRPKGK